MSLPICILLCKKHSRMKRKFNEPRYCKYGKYFKGIILRKKIGKIFRISLGFHHLVNIYKNGSYNIHELNRIPKYEEINK